jgi:outer membrane autotransporter protein
MGDKRTEYVSLRGPAGARVSIKYQSKGSGAFARWLLATSSLVAFSAAATTQAQAFPPCSVFNNTGSTASISVSNTVATGNGCNTGTVSPGGIAVTNSTINGSILDSGTIAGGIFVDGNSQINAIISAPAAIAVNGSGSSFAGGILNAGTLSSFSATIAVDGLASFSGGISNRGSINSGLAGTACGCAFGIRVANVTTFSGGISNGGTIGVNASTTASLDCANATATGIRVLGVHSFSEGIRNGGAIAATAVATATPSSNCGSAFATAYGISVTAVSAFSRGIANNGAIAASASATTTGSNCACAFAQASAYGINVTGVSTFSGGINNAGTISATATATASTIESCGSAASATAIGINVTEVGAFSGGVRSDGTITATATASASAGGSGQALAYGISVGDCGCSPSTSTFADGISNRGTITATATGLGSASAVAIGINVDNLLAFSGGISNGGTIAATASATTGSSLACAIGIKVADVPNYAGGINNNGTITATATNLPCGAAHAAGISVTNVTNFSGDIVNSGAITATTIASAGSCGIGIFIDNISTFTGRIVNSGTITGGVGIVIGPSTPGISIFSSGTITGTNGAAIDFQNAGGNTLTLGPGFVMNGSVVAQNGSNTFQLGGTGNGTFDLGALGTQYLGFDTFNVRSATWTVTGVYGLTSPWSVQGGTFLVDGDLTAAPGVNVTGGTLGGTGDGTTTGLLPDTTINSGGTLMPGLPGTPGGLLTIATGNLTMNPGSFYLVNVGTGTTGFTSWTNVANGGIAFINPGSLLAVVGSGAYTQGAHYTVLTATGGVAGTFSNPGNVALGHLGSMLANITYDANDVFLNLTPASLLSFLPAGTTINAINVANGINTANVGTPPVQFQNLFNLPPQQLGAALLQLSGEVGTGTQESGLQLMNSFVSLLNNPFGGSQGGAGPMMAFAPEREMFSPEIAEAYASALNDKAVLKAPGMPAPRYSYWGRSYGGTNATSGDPTVVGSHDVSTRALGFAAGADVRTAPGQVVGFSLGGANTTWGLSNNFGNGRSEAFQAGIYGSQQLGPAYVSGTLAYSNFWTSTDRTVTVAGTDRLSASFDAQGLSGRVESGYRILNMPVGVTPYAAAQAQFFHTPKYTETADAGSPQFALTYGEKNQTVVRTEVGSWFDQMIPVQGMAKLKLFGRAAWAHDFNNTPSLMNTFLALPAASFVVNGAKPPSNLALATAGAEYRLSNGVTVTGRFDGEFGKGSQTYAGTGTAKYEW